MTRRAKTRDASRVSSTRVGRLPIEQALASDLAGLHALLAHLARATEESERCRVMIVSPEHGDGTTTLATCTALMLVRHFRRDVALVEANLHTPAMAAYLGISPGPGLIDVARGSARSADAIRNSMLDGLYVLTAGGSRAPEEGDLAAEPTRELITRVSEEHRYTIIDAPPLLEHPDASVLLGHVDQVLLVVRAGSTRIRRAKAALQIVRDAGVKVDGVFLNRFRPNVPFFLRSRKPPLG